MTVVDVDAPRNAPADGVPGLLALDGLSPVELPARIHADRAVARLADAGMTR